MKIPLLSLMCLSFLPVMGGYAIERSVPLPYQFAEPSWKPASGSYLPVCASHQQYLAVEAGKLVCKSLPECSDGWFLTVKSGALVCAPAQYTK